MFVLDLLSDMNDLLNTDAHWMLDPCLNDARNQAHKTNNTNINKTIEANWYEYNAGNRYRATSKQGHNKKQMESNPNGRPRMSHCEYIFKVDMSTHLVLRLVWHMME